MSKEKFADKHPKLAEFIKTKAPQLLDIVGNYFPPAKILSTLINKEAPDMPPEDKIELRQLMNDYELKMAQLEVESEKEITERLRIDMTGDNWLSKNIRPLTLAFLLITFTINVVLAAALGAKYKVDDAYIEIYKTMLLAVIAFYFIGRDINKWKTISKK